MAGVGEEALSQETAFVISLKIRVAGTGLVLSVLEDPLLLVGESLNEEHDEEAGGDDEGQRLGGVGRGQHKKGKSLGPKQERLEHRDEAEAEELPYDLAAEHGELAHNLPAIVLAPAGVPAAAPEVEGHAAAPGGDAESEEETGCEAAGRRGGLRLSGVGDVVVEPAVDDGEDGPAAVDPAVVLGDFGKGVCGEGDEDAGEEGGDERVGRGAEGDVEEELDDTLSEGVFAGRKGGLRRVALVEGSVFSTEEVHVI